MHFDGKMKNNRRKIERGLGILPYGNFIMRTVGRHGEFRPCVRTWAVLATLPSTLPEGVLVCGVFVPLSLVYNYYWQK